MEWAIGGRRWRGRALCAIAGVHTLVAGVEFAPVWRELWAAGVVDSVGRDPLRGAVAWFFLFGVVLGLLGMAVDMLERQTPGWHSPALAAGLLAGALFGAEFACIYLGLQYTSASRLTVFFYTSPFWVAVLLPLSRIVPPLYEFRIRSRVFRWYGQLRDIEDRMQQDPSSAAQLIEELDALEETTNGINVPLSYADELYALRNNIRQVRQKLSAAG